MKKDIELTWKEIEEFGLEKAPENIGLSNEELEQLSTKPTKLGDFNE